MASAWIRQLVIQYYRRRRFLQYNFMDPGWGARIFYGGLAPLPPPPLAPALGGLLDSKPHISVLETWLRLSLSCIRPNGNSFSKTSDIGRTRRVYKHAFNWVLEIC